MVKKISSVRDFKKPHTINVRISPELHQRIERIRKQRKLSRSDVVRDALRHFFSTR